ncbi:MAG TPA: cation:dicarboxylase symporter family transporter, partial [Chitinophagaceae bacterium]|nr:cation:dicarboxylase symporter family transporter [Chitinophagaceae bacterium]
MTQQPQRKNRLTLFIFLALILGIGLGLLLNTKYVQQDNLAIQQVEASVKVLKSNSIAATDTATLTRLTEQKAALVKARDAKLEPFSLLADIFLRLIKMIVAPLVFSTLVVGVAKLGDIKSVGRIGGKTLLWFFCASLLSLALGMLLVNLFQPGAHMHLPMPDAGT